MREPTKGFVMNKDKIKKFVNDNRDKIVISTIVVADAVALCAGAYLMGYSKGTNRVQTVSLQSQIIDDTMCVRSLLSNGHETFWKLNTPIK